LQEPALSMNSTYLCTNDRIGSLQRRITKSRHMKKQKKAIRRYTCYLLLFFLLHYAGPLSAQKLFLSDSANLILKSIPEPSRDSFFYEQGKYYYAFYTRESYHRAMECYLEALRIAIKYNHQQVITRCYFGIGSVYDANNNFHEAIRYYKMHYDGVLMSRPFEVSKLLRATYNIAATYEKANNMDNAYLYALKMGEMVNWVTDLEQKQKYLLLIAHVLSTTNKEQFLEYFKRLPDSVSFKDEELAYGRLYAESKSQYYIYTGKPEKAVDPILAELAHTRDSVPLLNLVIEYYALVHDYEKAYKYQQILSDVDLRTLDRNTYGDINYRLLEADNLLKQRDNKLLILKEQQLNLRSTLLYLLSILLTVGLGITFFFYRRFRTRSRVMDKQNNLIKKQYLTNTLLLKEIHHRVKNNLQIISSMIELQLNKPETDLFFSMRDIQTKMRTIAIAHQMMYEENELKQVSLQTYFEKMVTVTLEILAVFTNPMKKQIHMNGNKLDIEILITLALAVNEMLINTVKHVMPYVNECHINMECIKQNGKFHFTYTDNGSNFHDCETAKSMGTGMRLIRKLARQIDADINITAQPEGNLQYLLVFSHEPKQS
jgi:two-component sensor histidine kinase